MLTEAPTRSTCIRILRLFQGTVLCSEGTENSQPPLFNFSKPCWASRTKSHSGLKTQWDPHPSGACCFISSVLARARFTALTALVLFLSSFFSPSGNRTLLYQFIMRFYEANMSDDKLLNITQAYNSIFSTLDFSQQILFFHFLLPSCALLLWAKSQEAQLRIHECKEYRRNMARQPYPSQMSLHSRWVSEKWNKRKKKKRKAQLKWMAAIWTFYSCDCKNICFLVDQALLKIWTRDYHFTWGGNLPFSLSSIMVSTKNPYWFYAALWI